jgi:hypothetical protein
VAWRGMAWSGVEWRGVMDGLETWEVPYLSGFLSVCRMGQDVGPALAGSWESQERMVKRAVNGRRWEPGKGEGEGEWLGEWQ